MSNFTHYQFHYASFGRRLFAFLLDTLMIGLITTSLTIALFGYDSVMQMQSITADYSIEWNIFIVDRALPAIWTIAFWLAWKATPGKLLLDCQIVDADTLQTASTGRLILRYLCYFISALPIGLGFLWIVFNRRNQGWHDKLANTVVIMQDDSLLKLESYS
ncbi:MAG: RDD family protein [Gammaproteobacteria bacterium]|nr:RDD family protein [Gammaproteobacteria bacterium]